MDFPPFVAEYFKSNSDEKKTFLTMPKKKIGEPHIGYQWVKRRTTCVYFLFEEDYMHCKLHAHI